MPVEDEKTVARGGNMEMREGRRTASQTEGLSATAPDDHDCIDWNSGGACFICRRTLSIEEQAPEAWDWDSFFTDGGNDA